MTTGGVYYDGPSRSFAAGTWVILYKLLFGNGGSAKNEFTVRLWDGTTIYDESMNDNTATSAGGYVTEVSGMAVVILTTTTTLKLSATADHSGCVMEQDATFSSSSTHTASRMVGMKVA
jgi:hypothetical protein